MGSDLSELRVFQEAEALSQVIWQVIERWDRFAKSTVGGQLVRAADSVGANIAEAYGRYHYADKIRILYIARGSLSKPDSGCARLFAAICSQRTKWPKSKNTLMPCQSISTISSTH